MPSLGGSGPYGGNDPTGGYSGSGFSGYSGETFNTNKDLFEAAYKSDLNKGARNTLASSFASLLTGGIPIASILGNVKGVSDAKDALTQYAGKDVADQIIAEVGKAYAETKTNGFPGNELDFMKMAAKDFDISNMSQRDKDRLVESVHQPNPGNQSPSSRDWGEYQKNLDYRTDLLQNGRYRYDRGQEMGLAPWYKDYLRGQGLPGEQNTQTSQPASSGNDSSQEAVDMENTPQGVWNKFISIWDGKTPIGEFDTPEDMFNAGEDFLQDKAGDYTSGVREADTVQKNLLDSLISDAQTRRGYFKPVTFTAGGNEISFAPKVNRNTASLLADLGGSRFDDSMTSLDNILKGELLQDPTSAQIHHLIFCRPLQR